MRSAWVWGIPVLTLGAAFFTSGAAQVEVYMRAQGFPVFRRTSYLAMLNVVLGVAAVTGALIGGMMATFWLGHLPEGLPGWTTHYHMLFLTALVLRIVVFFGLMLRLPLPGTGEYGTIFRRLARSGLGKHA